MKESVFDHRGIVTISNRRKVWFNQKNFKLRAIRLLESMTEFWDEYKILKKYLPRQKE